MIIKLAKIAALFVVFLVVAGASAYLTLTFIIKSEDTVIVPDLVGKDVVTALEVDRSAIEYKSKWLGVQSAIPQKPCHLSGTGPGIRNKERS